MAERTENLLMIYESMTTSIITISHFSNVLSDDAFAASRAFTVHRSPIHDAFQFSRFACSLERGFLLGLGPWRRASFLCMFMAFFFPGSRCFGVSFDSTIPLGCIYRRSSSMQPFNQLRRISRSRSPHRQISNFDSNQLNFSPGYFHYSGATIQHPTQIKTNK